MSFKTLLYDVEDHILTIMLNRPDRLNAFNGDMFRDLMAAFDQSDADDDVRVVIITGSGRGFCAGADLERGGDTFAGRDESSRTPDAGGEVSRRIFRSLKPVIVAFNGPAVGVGLTFPLAADIRLATKNIKMGFVFTARGIIPEACSSWFLPRIVGISQALEWCYTGRVFRSEEALEAGLVRSLHEPDELIPAARELAREMVENASPISNTVLRHMMWKMLGASDPVEAHRIDTRGIDVIGSSPDAAEGVTAFLEKRKPEFPGRVSKDLPDYFPWWEEPTF
ncbi:MAG: crotonase/enoyl-CoA hydratase family protein [Candidatus Hydrogenedentota bacterium]